MVCESVEDCCFEKSTSHFSHLVFSLVSVHSPEGVVYTCTCLYTDTMVEQLLPSCLRGHVVASLQHVASSLFRGWEAKLGTIVSLDTLTREWMKFDLRARAKWYLFPEIVTCNYVSYVIHRL